MLKEDKTILIWAQRRDNKICEVVFELIAKSLKLKDAADFPVKISLAATSRIDETKFNNTGVSSIYFADAGDSFIESKTAAALSACIKRAKPDILLIGATEEGKAIAPLIAAKYNTGLTADCTELSWTDDGCLLQTRPAFGGSIFADIVTTRGVMQIATVKEHIFSSDRIPNTENILYNIPKIIQLEHHIADGGVSVLSQTCEKSSEDLVEAEVIFALGRGVKASEDINRFSAVASKLGAALGCSRALVEAGLMPFSRQIGFSGRVVKPKLLVTFGVSGSVQFLAGIKNAKRVIAVNTDRSAPIFERADIAVTADLYDVLNELESGGI